MKKRPAMTREHVIERLKTALSFVSADEPGEPREALDAALTLLQQEPQSRQPVAGASIPDVATAKRCVAAIVDYLRTKDDSPRAAADLEASVRLLQQEPNGWQPIETAPKDGTTVLLIQHDQLEHGAWDYLETSDWDYLETSDWDGVKCYGWATDYGRIDEPTHWMPALPTPPSGGPK